MEDIVYNLLNWQSADLTILACAGIIYQLFSRVSPLPRILHNWTKTTIHHGTLKYNMEPLEPTTGNTRDTTLLWHNSFTLSLSLSLFLAQFGAESQMLIWFQSNICVFNVEHLPLINWFWHWYNFISGEGTQYRPEQRGPSSSQVPLPRLISWLGLFGLFVVWRMSLKRLGQVINL